MPRRSRHPLLPIVSALVLAALRIPSPAEAAAVSRVGAGTTAAPSNTPARKRAKTLTSAPRAKAEVPKPALRLADEGVLGYDWKEWHSLAAARDVRMRWRLGVVASGAAITATTAGVGAPGPSLSPLFEPEKDRTQWMITDTPLHRDGVLTIGVRVEF